MSPLDDELRRVLSARSLEAPLEIDPLAGIEKQAKQMRRRRTAIAVGGAVLSLALVAVAIPAVRGNLTGDDRADRVANSPTPEATPSGALERSSDVPINAYPWHRDVPEAQQTAVVTAWRVLHPDVTAVSGQGLWSGSVAELAGTVTVLQLWPRTDGGAEDAHTVFAVVDRRGVARIFHDQLTFFHEGGPGDPASATKDDVQRTTFETAVLRSPGVGYGKSEKQFWIVLAAPGVTSVKLSVGDGVSLDTTSGGGGAALPELDGAITTFRGEQSAFEGPIQERPVSLSAGDPLAWPTWTTPFGDPRGATVSNADPSGADDIYQQSHAALLSQFKDLVATAVLGVAQDPSGQVALVIGEYEKHGYGPSDSVYVVGAWIKPVGGPGELVGLHDVGWGIEAADARVPDDSSLGHGMVLAVGGPGWGVEYKDTNYFSDRDPYVQFLAVPPLKGKYQIVASQGTLSDNIGTTFGITRELGRGLTFPDV